MSLTTSSRSLDFRGFSDLLSHCISHAEKSVQRMNLNNIRLRLFGFCLAEDNIQVELRPRILPALRPEAVGSSGCHKPETKKFRSVSSEDCLFPDQSCHGWPTFTLMKSIAELSASAVTSGAALYPGCTNSENCPTVILCSQNEFWTDHNVAEIAKVVDYFYHITRVEIQSKGIALLINAKNVGDCIAVVSAVICSFEVCVQKALRAVYFVVDSATNHHLVLDSFKLPSQVVAKVIAFENYDAVFEVFDRSQIPAEAGGSMIFCLEKWVEYRSLLEKFIRDCFVAANNLLTTTEDMMQTVDLPRSVRETEMVLTQHDEKIKKKLEDELFQKLSTAGKSSLQSISDIEQGFRNCRDLCDSAETAEELFQKLQSSADRLQFLADKRRQKLDGCLQLRRFEEEASQIVNRLCTEGEDLLQKFGSSGDNLRSTKLQLQEFNKSYSHFKDLVTKGKEVIEEVSLFTQLGICDELTGIKEICRELKSCTASYMTRMDVVKEILENTHNCYVLLDQSFEWALKTMKFVVDMKLEKEMNLSEVERSKSQLEDFMKEHPPFPLDVFTRMESLLPSLNNRRLTEQWLKAKGHYIEINALIKQRYETLIKVLNQSKSETSECAEAKSMTFLAETGTARTPLMTAASKISNEPKSQNDAGCCSHLSSGPTTWNKPVVSSATAPGAECNMLDSSVHPESVCLRLVEQLGDSQVDLDVFIPCSASQYGSIKCNSFDEVIPRLSQFEAADNTDPVGQYSSLANFSHSSNVVNYRSHSTGGISPTKTSRDTRPASVAFDVSEYMLKDDLSEANLKISDTNPCFNQNSLPESNRELVSHKPPSGVAYSSQKSLQSNFRSASLDKRHASLLSSSTTSVRNNTKPSWKSFRKVLNGFTDRDSNLKKHFFRRNSADSSANVVCADSTESLPGRLQDEDATVEPSCLLSDEDSRHQRHGWSNTPSNSHMIFSNRLALASHSQSVNDICIGNDETQKSRVLSLILRELVMTESDYIKSLKYVITNYIPELLSDNIVRPLHGKKNLIFGNIEKIYEFHSLIFLAKLQRCQNSPFQLGACFLQHESEFFLYALYNKNKPKADVLMEEFGTKYFQKKQRELNDRMDLNSYLLKPVQRMGKYALLLRQILKECPETHADFSDLKAALEMVKFQLRHGNDLLAMDCLRDCDVNLQEQGVLLRQNEFLVFHGRKKCLRQVFLFEEIIVFSKTKRCSSGQDLYLYKNSIKTSELGLTESVGESGCRFEVWFRKRTPGMTYVMQSHSSDVKQQWVDDISQLLWKQTFRNRERRMAEMACMGIGSKPSLDLKQSKDNINDRFVNICSSDRTRAMRPKSVSFSPCYDSQRPHSMISVSSVSLSGSSFSSGYGSCLSSGYGAITGALLTTTKESPLEYIELSCEEAVSEATLCNAEVKDSGLECITTLASSNSMDDSHTMDLSASNSNDSGFIERGCMAAEERSRAKPEGTGLFGLMKEDAYTQTTLERPHKTLAMKGTAPIVSVESDCDDFY